MRHQTRLQKPLCPGNNNFKTFTQHANLMAIKQVNDDLLISIRKNNNCGTGSDPKCITQTVSNM